MAFSIPSTLEKMQSRDKDFRYMALADLSVELQKDSFKLDNDSEKKLTDQILKLLQDSSNQVQEQVVKIMGPLSKRVKDSHVLIVETLCNHLLTEKKGTEELRELSSMALKIVVSEIPSDHPTLPPTIVKILTPRLIRAISGNEDRPDTVSYCLEALNILLEKFGSHMVSDHENVLKAIELQLKSKRNATRKKAIGCLGHLAVTIPDALFAELVKNLVDHIGDASKKQDEIRTYMQAIGSVSRSVGYRLGKYLGDILPRVIKYCSDPKFENDDELRENCFQCFESLIYRCPKDVTPYLEQIQGLCLQYISHDPNYAQSDDDMETDDADEEEEEDDDQENYSDDDDMSWKVRRASVKCLVAIINTRPDLLSNLYTTIAPILIQRFGEREENVKLDVFLAFNDLLKQTGMFSRRNAELVAHNGPLQQLIPKIVAGSTKQLKGKSLKTRSGVFSLLRELVTVAPGSLGEHTAALVPGIQLSLGDKNTDSNLKIETLSFLRLLLQSHVPTVFHSHLKALTPPVFKAIKDPYYRTSAEALRVASELVHVLRPKNVTFDYKPFVQDLFNATLDKLKTQEIDQEVKEAAITCMGLVLANLGDELRTQTPEVLKIFLDRLGNEITRLTTAKALEVVASSSLHLDLSPVLGEVIEELAGFLNKHNRQLVQTSLLTLGVVVKNYGKETKVELYKNVLTKLSPLISVGDLHLTHLALNLATSTLQSNPASAALMGEQNIVSKSLELLKSSLLGGLALDSLLAFFSELVKSNAPNYGYDSLLEQFVALVNGKDTPKQVLSNTAKAIAAISSHVDGGKRDKTVNRFIAEAKGSKDDQSKHLALFALGEIGRFNDLSSHEDLEKAILSSFDSASEETRQAASFALGSVAVGNLKHFVPHVVNEVKGNSKSKYLLLHSLREIIVRQSTNPEAVASLRAFQDEMLPILFSECESEEEGVRNVVAECLGKLALVSPQELVPALTKSVSSKSAFTRSTVVSALKYAIVEKPQVIDELLLTTLPTFLNSLSDSDLIVRRNTLFTLNYAAHNKPQLIRDILPQYLPLVYKEAKVKPELIREVDLGPFKHKVDDGLEIRRAAYETMYTLLDSAVDRINIAEFIAGPVVDGLNDTYDIKMLSHLMILRLCHTSSASLLESIELLIEPLRVTVTNKVKEGSVQQDVDRNDELVRSTLRAIVSISRIPNADSVHKWEEFLQITCKTGELADKFNTIRNEMEHSEVQSSNDMDTS